MARAVDWLPFVPPIFPIAKLKQELNVIRLISAQICGIVPADVIKRGAS
jgi:hypothetical protein